MSEYNKNTFSEEVRLIANQKQLNLLKQGKNVWNEWRKQQPDVQIDLSMTILLGAGLNEYNLNRADLRFTTLSNAYLLGADLSGANLNGAELNLAFLNGANLSEANLRGANLMGANLNLVNFSRATLNNVMLDLASLVRTDFTGANLTNCSIYGISAWDVQLEGATQFDLVITPAGQPKITVDNLKIAQFIYLLLNNPDIREVIDTITSKVVLILGRFTPERKAVLDALKDELRKHDYTPVLFDFEKPVSRDFTETVRTLAYLSRFILADITEPTNIPLELQAIIPDLEVPIQPLLEESKKQFSMFPDLRKYSWVFPIHIYKDQASLIASLQDQIIEPADKKARELAIEKAKRLERP